MTPIALKSLGTDENTGLEKRISVYYFSVDSKKERIIIDYCVEVLDKNGEVFKVLNESSYIRYNRSATLNKLANNKFDALKNSAIGLGITSLIQNDLDSYDGTQLSLQQD